MRNNSGNVGGNRGSGRRRRDLTSSLPSVPREDLDKDMTDWSLPPDLAFMLKSSNKYSCLHSSRGWTLMDPFKVASVGLEY